jgi:hypothetical protein
MFSSERNRHGLQWFLSALALSAACLVNAHAQTALGSIEGVVVDADNAPVAGVTVYPFSGPAGTGVGHGAITNADGRFRIEQMVPGTYKLSAFKPEDGYADTSAAFYAQPDHPLPTVTVSSATQNGDLSIQLGERCGILHIEVADAVTHRPITSAALVLRQRNTGGASMQGDKSFPGDFLVPPVDLSVSVHQAGYTGWKFSEEGRDYLTLRPGEHRSLRAELQPLPAK